MGLAILNHAQGNAMPVTTPFAQRLLHWFDTHGRHDLPWQVHNDPYKVWVSEIMLQQTQVKTVLNYFDRFMQRFPDVESLAQASWDDVAPYWAGLGYYARARNLHKAAQQVVAQGGFPQTLQGWMDLSGIGRSTAGALMSLGLGQYGVIMDGNVKRVLARHEMIAGDTQASSVVATLWQWAEQFTPTERNSAYTQAIMDLGATVCTSKKPLCLYCPVNQDCQAFLHQRVMDFPQKKAKVATPEKHADVLILEHSETGQWLWQQRPTEGLWGGLYCLPIVDDEQLTTLTQRFALEATKHEEVMIKHGFTHFTWYLTVKKFTVPVAQHAVLQEYFQSSNQQSQWFTTEQAILQGLPKAMHTVIQASTL